MTVPSPGPAVRWGCFGLLVALSLWAFLSPATPQGGPEGSDKVVHALIFATLAVAGRWAGARALPLGLGLVGYAALTELLQALLPLGRQGDPADFAADVVGVALGLLLAGLVVRGRRVTGPAAGRRAPRDPVRPPG